MSLFATPRAANRDGLSKTDLVDDLVVIMPVAYEPNKHTKYGETATLIAEIVVVTGEHAGETEERFWCAGNLAKQIGDALMENEIAPMFIRSGKAANGNQWFGADWDLTTDQVAEAEAAWLAAHPVEVPRDGAPRKLGGAQPPVSRPAGTPPAAGAPLPQPSAGAPSF